MKKTRIILLPSITFFFLMIRTFSSSLDTIAVHQNFIDGDTIVSRNSTFELGFFSPGSSKYRYLGIWYKNSTPHVVVWVANHENPVTNNSSSLKLNNQGNLTLVNGDDKVIWSSNSSTLSGTNINLVAQLLDTGNLVIKNENEIIIWQSFDYPRDTHLPEMKLGKNFITGRETYLTSWKSADDPSPGEYTLRSLTVKGKYSQAYIWKNSVIQSRIAPSNGITFAGRPTYKPNPSYIANYYTIVNEDEMYHVYTFKSNFLLIRSIITPDGKQEVWHLNTKTQKWTQDLYFPSDKCDGYGVCGPNGICSTIAYNICGCMKGFELKNKQEMSADNWSSGCRRIRSLDCGPDEGFVKFSSLKLPDTQNAAYDQSMSLQECEVACKNNCSCIAYANPNMTEGAVGCLLWFGDLIDIRVYSQNGQDLYVRMAATELSVNSSSSVNSQFHSRFPRKKRLIFITTFTTSAVLVLILSLYFITNRKRRPDAAREGSTVKNLDKDHNTSGKKGSIELTMFKLSIISKATNKFSIDNKLGQGGFGPVYKGVLEEGQEIAVKCLSKTSKQGLDEFENEVICIAKLQHRNLVKLLGCCIKGEEIMLVYEYVPNKSLDLFIFGRVLFQICRTNL